MRKTISLILVLILCISVDGKLLNKPELMELFRFMDDVSKLIIRSY